MEKKNARVPLYRFWTRSSTKSFYQMMKGTNVSAEVLEDPGDNSPG